MGNAKKRIVVVLGMHRSGTSAITRGLKVLGVNLGDRLMQSIADNNDRGFWEDNDIFVLNENLLRKVGLIWHSTKIIDKFALLDQKLSPEKEQAVELLREKTRNAEIFGFKDPRMSILLPFWQEVFKQLQLNDSYLIALRNPISVAGSLYHRDGIASEKSFLLWTKHIIGAICDTKGKPRIVVDYDRLLNTPTSQLGRISKVLALHTPDEQHEELQEYIKEFLTKDLRHYKSDMSQLKANLSVPSFSKAAYFWASKLARDKIDFDDPLFMQAWGKIENDFKEFSPLYAHLDQLELERQAYQTKSKELATKEARLSKAQDVIVERDRQINLLEQTVTDKDQRATELQKELDTSNELVATKEARLSKAQDVIDERDSQIDSLQEAVSMRDGQIASLAQTVAEGERHSNEREGQLAERDARIVGLDKAIAEHEGRIEALIGESDATRQGLSSAHAEMAGLRQVFVTSTSWKLTAPVRAVKTGLAKIARGLRAIPAAIRFGGGVLPTARKAARVLRREGMVGVKWRMEHAQIAENASPTPTAHYKKSHKTVANVGGSDFKGVNVSYIALRQEVLDSGLWDEKWYLSKYYENYIKYKRKKSNGEYLFPLDYYLQEGWKVGHEPSNLLPVQINQQQVGCSKIEYFLHRLRFAGYQFDENVWTPSEKRIDEYLRQKQHRNSTKIIYTCIVQDYDELMQPYYIAADWDYVCFTDDPDLISQGNVGVWEIRPMSNKQSSATRANRWHKIHPYILFPAYEESIYVDGNINILSDYIFDQITKRGARILLPGHFVRNCIYREIEALLSSPRISSEDKSLLVTHRQFLEQEGFPEEFGLSENNLIYRRHRDDSMVKLMREWWDMYGKYSSRDQASLAYVFWKNDMSLRAHMFTNCRVNYKDFWVVKHVLDRPGQNYLRRQVLTPAFARKNVAVVFSTNEQFIPYLGVAIYSLIENASDDYNYDVVILARGLDAALAKICDLARGHDNVLIRVYDTTALIESLPTDIFHVEGYVPVETYNKCFITEILSGYDRCVYLDSDIVVLDDIQKLHDLDLEGCAVGASVNVANVNAAYCNKVIKERRFDEYLEKDLGVLDRNKYFQAGVVVLDMKKLGRMNLRQLTIDALKKVKKPIFFDQCIFNSIFYGNVCFFSTAWNHVWYMQQYSYLRGSVPDQVFFDYAHGRVDPKIIHYAGASKPQNHIGWKLSDEFWKYAYNSPFFEGIRNNIIEQKYEVAPFVERESGYEWSRVKPRLLVHLHLYYIDQVDVMVDALQNITDCDYDLFVTMVERNKPAEKRLRKLSKEVRFLVLPNAGYDTYPFLHVIKQVRLANYDFVLKIHTKNARGAGQDEVYGIKVPGYTWRDDLQNAVLGSKEVFDRNLRRFAEDKQLGCIGAGKYIFSTQDNNEENTYSLAEWRHRCGVTQGIHYVGGSMFLARAYPFERIKGMNMQAKDFESPTMGTKDYKNKAHIFERLLGIVVENEGFDIRGG